MVEVNEKRERNAGKKEGEAIIEDKIGDKYVWRFKDNRRFKLLKNSSKTLTGMYLWWWS